MSRKFLFCNLSYRMPVTYSPLIVPLSPLPPYPYYPVPHLYPKKR